MIILKMFWTENESRWLRDKGDVLHGKEPGRCIYLRLRMMLRVVFWFSLNSIVVNAHIFDFNIHLLESLCLMVCHRKVPLGMSAHGMQKTKSIDRKGLQQEIGLGRGP